MPTSVGPVIAVELGLLADELDEAASLLVHRTTRHSRNLRAWARRLRSHRDTLLAELDQTAELIEPPEVKAHLSRARSLAAKAVLVLAAVTTTLANSPEALEIILSSAQAIEARIGQSLDGGGESDLKPTRKPAVPGQQLIDDTQVEALVMRLQSVTREFAEKQGRNPNETDRPTLDILDDGDDAAARLREVRASGTSDAALGGTVDRVIEGWELVRQGSSGPEGAEPRTLQRVAERIRTEIVPLYDDEAWAMPDSASMAKDLGVPEEMVNEALDVLQREGVVSRYANAWVVVVKR